ncbi:hypothetical protein BVRB_2g025080 [Beta vulgaris subsp. vulgaris]|nr:hypothetical protein BVRB_2g025080 [Beta vulgaris subsp. vulgaris]
MSVEFGAILSFYSGKKNLQKLRYQCSFVLHRRASTVASLHSFFIAELQPPRRICNTATNVVSQGLSGFLAIAQSHKKITNK